MQYCTVQGLCQRAIGAVCIFIQVFIFMNKTLSGRLQGLKNKVQLQVIRILETLIFALLILYKCRAGMQSRLYQTTSFWNNCHEGVYQTEGVYQRGAYNYNSTNLHRKGSVTWLCLLDKRSLIRSKQLVYFYFYPEFQFADFIIFSQEKIEIEKTVSLSKKAGSIFFRQELYNAVHIYLVSSNPSNHMHSNCCY